MKINSPNVSVIIPTYNRSNELRIARSKYSDLVHSIEFFTGICVVKVDRSKCSTTSRIENDGTRNNATDFRYENDGVFVSLLRRSYNWISWDTMNTQRAIKHPTVTKLMMTSYIRHFFRLFIVPIRLIAYSLLKYSNRLYLRRALGRISKG